MLFFCYLILSSMAVFSAGSNMPCTAEAVDVFRKANVLIAPAIAAGAGGVSFLTHFTLILQFYLLFYQSLQSLNYNTKALEMNSLLLS